MKTVKLDISNEVHFLDDMRSYNRIRRMAFNRFREGMEEKDVRTEIAGYYSEGSWFTQCAIMDAKGLNARVKDGKAPLFGGKHLLHRYLTHKITKEEYRYARLSPICIQGERLRGANRSFDFDLTNCKVTWKASRDRHVDIHFVKPKKNVWKELRKVQKLIDLCEITVTVRFNEKYLWLSYEESLTSEIHYEGLKPNRILGIDMNPSNIGISIIEFDEQDNFKVLHKEVFDIYKLTLASGKSSDDTESKYRTNKRKHETIQIAHIIDSLMDVWKCGKLSIEELKIKPSDKKKGKKFNRVCNNVWNRRLFKTKLNMLANEHGYVFVEVNPAYSSVIGNFEYGNENTPDSIAASIEIARRAHKKFQKGWIIPAFNIHCLDEQWKQTLGKVGSWKALSNKIKKLGLKYRFLLLDYLQNAVFSKNHTKANWACYAFS